ncbi:putative fumarate hydratase subunit alpha [Thermoclostridium stercorarium subsp. stercorarium DSM 8532]|uniref:Fumarate hydratase n=3 Tax=Thermoclostridium stercorarium TaxID=1510 RepID=A0A1B1YJY3_THEST|nr:fumarate hydratase [Thermoclostridium stercorarium]AGC68158.1 putative fumarate hydratase subunit alpha [Thermoclostridium stercorarium subsp. stercorarium DSM 8532]ANW98531.1 fumarate hydratase [Thermoclostridium stercorarium subsp. thermolacticum DSM 2910]ANX01066.1 fumarate hydratase [Thermoclostridium stercorarium subsp. leptospartum DSM 9219]UZQ86683.1 fumarate hydratase [Thermoclostridium stercorarium]
MKEIHVDRITECVEKLCIDANYYLNPDIYNSMKTFLNAENSENGKTVLDILIKNADIARNEGIAICQDTGMAVVFLEVGQDVHIVGGNLYDAVNEGVRRGYRKGYLRASVVKHPLKRVNTGDNTPAVIYTEIVDGDKIRIDVAPKGFGSENMSAVKMLKPSDGIDGVRDFVIKTVSDAGPNPCPPVIVGVGIGGTMEKAALLSKKALLRPVGSSSADPDIAELERELLCSINRLGIGPGGLGGNTTALGVNIEVYPTHIAGLPVAVNIGCHATRHASAIIE